MSKEDQSTIPKLEGSGSRYEPNLLLPPSHEKGHMLASLKHLFFNWFVVKTLPHQTFQVKKLILEDAILFHSILVGARKQEAPSKSIVAFNSEAAQVVPSPRLKG